MQMFVRTALLVASLGMAQAPQEPVKGTIADVASAKRTIADVASAKGTIADVAWIAGSWTSGTAATVEERWTPPAGGAMLGTSRTIRGDRMSAFEFLRIVERNGGLVYIAQPNGRTPTEFTMTKIEGTSVTFENPAHDFPKMIRYAKRPDGGLEASISGAPGTKAMTWTFTLNAR